MNTEIYKLDSDLKVFCVTAESFPKGILNAHKKLHSLLLTTTGRRFFGISYPGKDGETIYKAAVEELYPGEAEKYGCEVFIVKKGEYISTYIQGSHNDLFSIGKAFNNLLTNFTIDPKGCCVEMYIGDNDVRCMVKLNS